MIERVALSSVFRARTPIVGMIHLMPLPGAPRFAGAMRPIVDRAVADAVTLADAGFDGVLVENFGDVPFHADRVEPETIAAMTACISEIARAVAVPFGVNVLRNDAAAALGIAVATGAAFIRVNVHAGAMLTDQGWLAGRAGETLRRRAALRARVALLADVLVKHAVAPPGLNARSVARDTWQRGLADALIVSGGGTGEPTPVDRIHEVRSAVSDAPIWIGSGLNAANGAALLAHADGAIVGSALQHGGEAGHAVDPALARAVLEALKGG
jgi:uncharacterized protein